MFKKLFVLIILSVCLITFSGCNNSEVVLEPLATVDDLQEEIIYFEEEPEIIDLFEMELIGSSDCFYYYREKATDVLYIQCYEGFSGGLTVMLDPEKGLPLTYERYIELYDSLYPEIEFLNKN